MNKNTEKDVKEIIDTHHKVIEDWTRACLSQTSIGEGIVNPHDFILVVQEPVYDKMTKRMVRKYWFELKKKKLKKEIRNEPRSE